MPASAPRLFDEAYLRRLESLALLTRRAANSQMQGERRSSQRGQSVEFADYRLYVPGDDFRRIDWNAYARLERLFIKIFVEEQDLTVHLLLDVSASMGWGQPAKLDYAIRLAGSIGYVALLGLDRLTAAALGSGLPPAASKFPPVRGKSAALRLFTYLLSLHAASRTPQPADPYAWLSIYAAGAGRPGPLLLFSDLYHDSWQPGLSLLAGRGYEITVLHLLSPEELDPELAGDFKLLDAEEDRPVEITANFESLERYRLELQAWQDDWRRFCAGRGIAYLPVSTAELLEELLFAALPRQGVLR